jgi:hypothetical protein
MQNHTESTSACVARVVAVSAAGTGTRSCVPAASHELTVSHVHTKNETVHARHHKDCGEKNDTSRNVDNHVERGVCVCELGHNCCAQNTKRYTNKQPNDRHQSKKGFRCCGVRGRSFERLSRSRRERELCVCIIYILAVLLWQILSLYSHTLRNNRHARDLSQCV